jgi:hypothetical protein
MAPISANIPIPANAAQIPIPALALDDKPLGACEVFGEGRFEDEDEVGVATFQPLISTALMAVEELMARVVVKIPLEAEQARYVITWPGINGDLQTPTARPGCSPARS